MRHPKSPFVQKYVKHQPQTAPDLVMSQIRAVHCDTPHQRSTRKNPAANDTVLGDQAKSSSPAAKLSRILPDLAANLRGRNSNLRHRSQPKVDRVASRASKLFSLLFRTRTVAPVVNSPAAKSPVTLGTAVPLPRSRPIFDKVIVSVVQVLLTQVEGLLTTRPALP